MPWEEWLCGQSNTIAFGVWAWVDDVVRRSEDLFLSLLSLWNELSGKQGQCLSVRQRTLQHHDSPNIRQVGRADHAAVLDLEAVAFRANRHPLGETQAHPCFEEVLGYVFNRTDQTDSTQ